MHLIENTIFFIIGLALFLFYIKKEKTRKYSLWLTYFAALLAIIDIVQVSFRWQMSLIYVLIVLLFILQQFKKPNENKQLKINKLLFSMSVLFGCIFFSFSVFFPKAFVTFEIPAPSGAYGVGIKDIYLIDKSRQELATEDESDVRELMVRAWYPAEIKSLTPEPFVRDLETVNQVFNRTIPLPSFAFNHLTNISSHSYLNAPVSKTSEKFPVLFFSHGNSYFASQNTLLMEHLASHGYIVLAIEHSYHAARVEFPTGKVALYKTLPFSKNETEQFRDTRKQYYQGLSSSSYEEYLKATKELLEVSSIPNDRIQTWSEDILFVLDQFEQAVPAVSEISKKINFEQLAVFGMSLGGATAGKLCVENSRFKAGLNMDGMQYGHNSINDKLKKPFMVMDCR